jgi:hypothetical protein
MHYLPGALFGSKDHRDPQGERRYIFTSADLGLRPLYLHNVGKLRSYVLLYDLGANELAVSDLRCSMLPSLRGSADRRVAYVSMGDEEPI